MNLIDLILLAFLAVFIIGGYRKGIIVGLSNIAALLLGIYAAVHFSKFLNEMLVQRFDPSPNTAPILSFIFTFLLVVIAVILVARLTGRFADIIGLGFLNRLFGALLGIVKGVILASLILFFIGFIDPGEGFITPRDKQDSFLYQPVASVFPKLMKLFGGEIKFPKW